MASFSADFWSGAATVPTPCALARMMATRQLRRVAVGFFGGRGIALEIAATARNCESSSRHRNLIVVAVSGEYAALFLSSDQWRQDRR
jgi:hypothetical protein